MRAILRNIFIILFSIISLNGYTQSVINGTTINNGGGGGGYCFEALDIARVLIELHSVETPTWDMPNHLPPMFVTVYGDQEPIWTSGEIVTFHNNRSTCEERRRDPSGDHEVYKIFYADINLPTELLNSLLYPCESATYSHLTYTVTTLGPFGQIKYPHQIPINNGQNIWSFWYDCLGYPGMSLNGCPPEGCDSIEEYPSCSDGVMNGNETGVDCGGPDCDPCGGGESEQEPDDGRGSRSRDNDTNIFPNPFDDVLNLKMEANIEKITVCNVKGQIIYEDYNGISSINTSDWDSGYYIIKLKSELESKSYAVFKM